MKLANYGKPLWLQYLVIAGVLAMSPLTATAESWNNRLFNEVIIQPAEDASGKIFANTEIIATADLAELRGGFTVAGLEMSFGATLRTMIDNIRLETVMNITETGANIVSQTLQNTNEIRNGIARQTQQVTLVGPNGGNSVVKVTPEGVNIPGLEGFSGTVLNDAKGFTAALHNITRDAILSTVISNASNRNIRQELDIRLNIHNMEMIRAAQLRSTITNALLR